MDVEEHDHSLHVHFHPSALSTVNNVDSEGRQLKTLEEVRLVLHHQQVGKLLQVVHHTHLSNV